MLEPDMEFRLFGVEQRWGLLFLSKEVIGDLAVLFGGDRMNERKHHNTLID
jgi:hypothetical protein